MKLHHKKLLMSNQTGEKGPIKHKYKSQTLTLKYAYWSTLYYPFNVDKNTGHVDSVYRPCYPYPTIQWPWHDFLIKVIPIIQMIRTLSFIALCFRLRMHADELFSLYLSHSIVGWLSKSCRHSQSETFSQLVSGHVPLKNILFILTLQIPLGPLKSYILCVSTILAGKFFEKN